MDKNGQVPRVKKENRNKETFPPVDAITVITIICRGQITYIAHTSWLYWESIPFFSFQKHQLASFLCISELPGFLPHSNARSSLQNLYQSLTWTWTSPKISRLWIVWFCYEERPNIWCSSPDSIPIPPSDLYSSKQDKNSGSCWGLSPTPTLLQRHMV